MISGEKVILRYPKIEDAKWLLKNVTEPSVLQNMNNPFLHGLTLKKEIKWAKNQATKRRKKEAVIFVIIDKENKNLLGSCGFNKINEYNSFGEIGYWIAKEYWGRGYATDAARLLLNYGFKELKLSRVEALCNVTNIGSWKLMEKIGMKKEGTLRDRGKKGKKVVDAFLYSILRSEWKGSAV